MARTQVASFGILLLICLFPRTSSSQTYPFKAYSISSGLVHSNVRVVYQDSTGFLWFGTQGGLNRYDGNEFLKHLSRGKEKSAVHALYEDVGHTLFVGTYGNGIATLRPGDTTAVWMTMATDSLPGDIITAFHRDRQGNLWIGTDGGLVVRFPGGKTRVFRDEFGVRIGEIYGIARDESGVLWIAGHSGLFRVNFDAEWRVTSRRLLTRPARSVLVRRNGDVIVGTSGGGNDKFGVVCRVRDTGIDTIISYHTSGRLIKAQALFEDENNALWVGTQYGVYMLYNGMVRHIGTQNGLQNEDVYCIAQDHEGTMWFGTTGGVVKLPRPSILSYGMKDGFCGHGTLTLLEDMHGDIWVGMYSGLNRIARNGSVQCWDETDGLVHHTIRSIAMDGRGRLWLSTPQGLNLVEQGSIHPCPVSELKSPIDAWNICGDRRGGLWIGLRGKLVNVTGEEIALALDSSHGLTQDVAQPLCVDREGRLWFTNGHRGVGVYAKGKIRFVTTIDGLPTNRVHCMLEDSRGMIWIGTDAGVAQWSDTDHRVHSFPEPNLSALPIYVIMEDSLGKVWFGADHGVFEYDGSSLQQYSVDEGLSNDVIQTGLVCRNGDVWLGTNDGVSRFERMRQVFSVPIPTVYLRDVLAGDLNTRVAAGENVAHDDRSVVFTFNTLSYVNEHEIRFQWMLRGIDSEWLAPQKQRQVRYTNLSPGDYVFSVRAANKNGEWSSATSFVFAVLPAFWQTWWFILLSVAVISAMVYGVYRYRLGQILRVERMRTRIAADLHDDVASSLSSVALYSDVIQHELKDLPGDVPALLSRISNLSREVMGNIALIVWAVDPRRDELTEVFQYFQRHAAQLCSAAGISFVAQLPNDMKTAALTPDQRRTIFLILKEALNNALKHSKCSHVAYNCRIADHMMEMTLQDDGKGFVSDDTSKGHGLRNMSARASGIGAHVTIDSTPGVGTRLHLTMRIA